jgi:hypothetical protein
MSRRKRDQEEKEGDETKVISLQSRISQVKEDVQHKKKKHTEIDPSYRYDEACYRGLVPASHCFDPVPRHQVSGYNEEECMKSWKGLKYWNDSMDMLHQLHVYPVNRKCVLSIDNDQPRTILEKDVSIPELWCGDIWWMYQGDVYSLRRSNGGNSISYRKNERFHRDGDLSSYIYRSPMHLYEQRQQPTHPSPTWIRHTRICNRYWQYYDQLHQEYTIQDIMRMRGERHWHQNGDHHRDHDRPSFVIYTIKDGRVVSYKEECHQYGQLHTNDSARPACVEMHGNSFGIEYYRHGKYHSMRGPASLKIDYNGTTTKDYYIGGNLTTATTLDIIRKAATGGICLLRRRYRRSLIQYTRIPEVIIDRIILRFLVG